MNKFKVAVVAVFLAMSCVSAWAIPMATVGGIDTFLSSTSLANSSDALEMNWAGTVVGFDLTLEGKIEGNSGWLSVDNTTGVYALALTGNPAYFLVKTGNNGTGYSPHTDFLFENVASLSWAVVDLNALGIKEIGKVSHINQFNGGTASVPEPSTMLLIGSGLIGLGWHRRKYKKS